MGIDEPPAREQEAQQLRIETDHDRAIQWCCMHPQPGTAVANHRPCFHLQLIKEILEYQDRLGSALRMVRPGTGKRMPHVVLASDAEVFNLGGDLQLFAKLIRAQDRDGLLSYARSCVHGVHGFHSGLGAGAHSIALVQGDALGGGFEAALSCHTIVAESGAGMGLPEVLFDLFPGMGAYSFLRRRLSAKQAERMILSGTVYTSDKLYEMGVVDVLVPRGQGVVAVEKVCRRHARIANARQAMHTVVDHCDGVPLEELMKITQIWVDTALKLGDKSLKTMERLVRAQTRRHVDKDATPARTTAQKR
jgi:DSF synthase